MNWQLEDELPDGHRLFITNKAQGARLMYAIADDSGRTPEDTDDGILWLDFSRSLTIDKDESVDPPREHMSIPLMDDKGERTRTPTDASTMLHLANKLDWKVVDERQHAIYVIR